MKDHRILRRSFLAASLGASTVTAASHLTPKMNGQEARRPEPSERNPLDHEHFFANCRHWQALGRPHDWSIVRAGLHPFSPDRVVIIPDDTRHLFWGHSMREAKASVTEAHQRRHGLSENTFFDNFCKLCESEKGTTCLKIMKVLSDYYQAPEAFIDWATGLVSRESLGSSGIGLHVGLVHEFQRATPITTRNSPVDWWLFQAPEGMDFQSLDEKPVHLLFGIALSIPGGMVKLNALCALSDLIQACHSNDAITVSRMDRLSACRYLNRRVAEAVGSREA